MRTSSSASTTRAALVLIATIMGYGDAMSTSAPLPASFDDPLLTKDLPKAKNEKDATPYLP